MIDLTPTEAKVYESYRTTRNAKKTAADLKKSAYSITDYLRSLAHKGMLYREHNQTPYQVIDQHYTVSGKDPEKVKVKPFSVNMTETERKWMLDNYPQYRRNRDIPAKVLGRSRLDINFMAMELGLHIKEVSGNAKGDESRSA